jgi:multicomponent Na+:H+ antiporter subunit C
VSGIEVYSLCGAVLFVVGLHGLAVRPSLLVKIIALNVMSTGVFLLLVGLAPRTADGRPDPVPQAMVLTGIVVAVSVTAFALALARRLARLSGRARLSEDA